MAVQAQYNSKTMFTTREEQEMKDMNFSRISTGFIDQSTVLFNNGGDGNLRKRGREAILGTPEPMMALAQLQTHHQTSPLVSTGLRLAFDDNRQSNPLLLSTSNNINTSVFSAELAAEINSQNREIEQLIITQGESLRQNLREKRHCHARALFATAEESAARRLQNKEAELQLATRRQAELEGQLARLRAESITWEAKAVANQATAASLHAQLQAAASAQRPKPDELRGSDRAEDAESAFVDPDRVEPARACRTCFDRTATVVLLPCRHLCTCVACDAAAGPVRFCPVCRAVRTGSVQVFLD